MTTIDATKVDAFARRLFAATTTALAALVALSGCGGTSSSSSTVLTRSLPSSPGPTTTVSAASMPTMVRCDPEPCQLSRAQLAAKLDDLCLRGNAAVERADASFEQATKASDYTKAAAAMAWALLAFPPYEDTIQGLTPPAEDQAAFTRYVDLTGRIHGLAERIVAAGRARDTPEAVRLSQVVHEELATRITAAVDLGTKNCGR